MTSPASDLPAILGGPPVRPEGPPEWPLPNAAVAEAVQRALADGSWGKYHGPHCPRLTELLAASHECEFVFLCASGTAAVELALRGLQVGPGDEVILAAYDFKGNFQDVLTVGATPVLVDVHPDNWNLDPRELLAAIGPRTKAILVSHLHGGFVPMPEVMEFARSHNIPVIEDAAQMPLATVCGRIAGTWGDIGILSFGGSKLVTAGRGGALFTPHSEVAQRVKLYTQRGNEAYPLSELQAVAVVPQWAQLEAMNARRAKNVALLCDLLFSPPYPRGGRGGSEVPNDFEVQTSPHSAPAQNDVALPTRPPPAPPRIRGGEGLVPFDNAAADSQPGYYKLGLQYDPQAFGGLSRDAFAAAVRAEGIALDAGFRALHKTHSSRRFRAVGDLPHATRADSGVLTLHHPILLGSPDEMRQIVQAIEKVRMHAAEIRKAHNG